MHASGVPKDDARAFTFAERACASGVLKGCVHAALARIAGDGVAKDVKAGVEQLDALCTLGEPTGCDSLVNLYAKGSGADVPTDPVRVREYARKACDLGAKQSCDEDRLLGTIDHAAARLDPLGDKRP
ncbi:MAG TPA: hypothetical protein VGY54_18560 [Polyangiaceae bacterium]|nr:hypothetical protein [Polyangiaceae bacterium]